jgi:transposase
VALCNQLTAQLERCFPGAVGLFADLHSATAISFLRRYPTSQAAATLTQATLAAFLPRIHYSGRTPVAVLLARLKTAPVAAISPDQATGRAVCVQALLDAIQACHDRERELEAEIIERLEVHADQPIFTSLPKAGHGVRAAALLSEIGDVRARFPDEEALAALAGVAPVTRASGKLRSVGFRWACDKSCATRSSTSLTTPATPPHGRPASTPRPSSAPADTPRPCASWLAPGSASSGASGKTTPPTTPTKHGGAVRLLTT